MTRLLVLDFDGTMTDAEEEGHPYRQGYLEDVSTLSGLPLDEVLDLATRFETEVAENPHIYGWDFGGRIVAPAIVDPYLRMMPIARKVFDHAGAFSSKEERSRILDGILYKYNYPKTNNCFRPGARAVLESLKDTATYVVTNSHTEPVRNKLRSLGETPEGECTLDWLVERVHGSAKKYVLDDNFDAVPESMDLPGLPRPVLLRREKYHAVLNQLLVNHGLEWTDLVVVGDIFELDLSLPIAMGAKVGLLKNEFTPDYEQAFLEEHPLGGVLTAVEQIPEFAFAQ